MEHRWHDRHPIRMELELYRRGEAVATCHSRNVSREGMFFELDARGMGFEVGRCVQAVFTTGVPDSPNRHLFTGLIVHCSGEGMGVMLTGIDQAARRALDALIDGWEKAVASAGYRSPVAALG